VLPLTSARCRSISFINALGDPILGHSVAEPDTWIVNMASGKGDDWPPRT
jgi:hypothetical protein